mmetsp:Transcript_38173/g.61580  ORF Transcript_38173/g.61580 Transcript_38173/m.61580 type:complete len:255 (+) Transcript_38173:1221-1985(+)
MVALQQQSRHGHSLGGGPIDCLTTYHVLLLLRQLTLQAGVHLEACWHFTQLQSNLCQQLQIHTCGVRGRFVRRTDEALPFRGHPVHSLFGIEAVGCCKSLFVVLPEGCLYAIQLLLAGDSSSNQLLAIDCLAPWMLVDGLVQHWLRVLRRVSLIVAEASVAHDFDDDVVLPLLAPLGRQLEGGIHGNGVVAVDVQDGQIEGLSKVRGVHRRTVVNWICREANLIVDDHVYGAAHVEFLDMRQLQSLVHDSLTSK